jgi:tRNA pseudouridine55 synthase
MAAGFTLEDAVTLDAVQAASDPALLLRPVDSCFAQYPAVSIPPEAERKVRNGMAVKLFNITDGTYRVYGEDGGFLALSRAEQGSVYTIKSFFSPENSPEKEALPT